MEIVFPKATSYSVPVLGRWNILDLNSWIDHEIHLDGAQWSSLGPSDNPLVWTPRRDIVAYLLHGAVLESSMEAPAILTGVASQSGNGSKAKVSLNQWGIRTWPYNHYDYDYPRNPLLAVKALVDPTPLDYHGEYNTIHDKMLGTRVLIPLSERWVFNVGEQWSRTRWAYTLPGYSGLRAWAADSESAALLRQSWPTNEIPSSPYLGSNYALWHLYDAPWTIRSNGYDSWDSMATAPDLISALNSFIPGITHTALMPEGLMTWVVSDLSWSFDSVDSLSWRYTLLIRVNGGARMEGKWRVQAGFKLKPTGYTSPTPQEYGGAAWLQARAFAWVPWYGATLDYGVVHHGLGQHTIQNPTKGYTESYANLGVWQRNGPFIVGQPQANFNSSLHLAVSRTRASRDDFSFVVNVMMPELRRTAIYAVSDAVAGTMKVLDNNYVEVINELDGLPELIPDIKGLVGLLKSAPWDKIRAGLSLGRWVSGTFLQYSFGIAPTAGVIEELTRLGPSLARLLDNQRLLRQQRARGTFTFKLNSDDQRAMGVYDELRGLPVVLTTRAALDLQFPESPTLLGIANLYGLGLLPSASNVWATLPFSFAIDWFTNMSQRLSSVELSAITMLLKIRSIIVSYTVQIPESDDLYMDLGTRYSDVVFQAYRRELLNALPVLSEGKIDFLRASGRPPQAILAALLYQLSPVGKNPSR